MNTRTTLGLLVSAAFLLGGGTAAQALTMSETQSFPPPNMTTASIGLIGVDETNSDQATGSLFFAQFDPSLGTLTDVKISIDSFFDVFVDINVGDEIPGATGTATGTSTATLDFAGGQFTDAVSQTAQCQTDEQGGCDDNPTQVPTGKSLAGSQSVGPLAAYIGISTVQFDLTLLLDHTLLVGSGVDPIALSNAAGSWIGSITVEYTFDRETIPTPAPATIVPFAAGLAALGLGMARRRMAA